MVEKASDLIKDPVVLEFLGLEEKLSHSENDLETAIIDRFPPGLYGQQQHSGDAVRGPA